MNKQEIFKKAHKMTKEIKAKYRNVDYKGQFSICLKFILVEIKTINNAVTSKLNYQAIREILKPVIKKNMVNFNANLFFRLQDKFKKGICTLFDKYQYVSLRQYVIDLDTDNGIDEYIRNSQEIARLEKKVCKVIDNIL